MSQERKYYENSAVPRPKKRRRSAGRIIGFAMLYSVLVIIVSVILACLIWIAANDVLALNKPALDATVVLSEDFFTTRQTTNEDGTKKTVYTAKMGKVANLLEEEGLIQSKFLFRLFSSATNGEKKLRPGAYNLDTSMDFRSLIAGMGSNSDNRVIVKVTIPEGYTLAQTFRLLEDHAIASANDLADYATNYDYKFSFLQDIPLGDPNRLEGFLFPDTYEFYVNHDPNQQAAAELRHPLSRGAAPAGGQQQVHPA